MIEQLFFHYILLYYILEEYASSILVLEIGFNISQQLVTCRKAVTVQGCTSFRIYLLIL